MQSVKHLEPFKTSSMLYDGNRFFILDQTSLPKNIEWLPCDKVNDLIEIIQCLAIRGAPAIGISASILLALLAQNGRSKKQLLIDAETLRNSRPTAVNLTNNLKQMKEKIVSENFPESVIFEAQKILFEDIDLCERMARFGSSLIQPGEKILTHCNTGSLATAGRGTAFGIISEAQQQGKDVFVWIDETRPLLQGARLTAWECLQQSIPHKIICDNMAGKLMQQKEVDIILVGSDRIAANGDFANKIGTYSLAVLAKYHNVPFYVVAPHTTIDADCQSGALIPIEERSPSEVKGVSGSFGSCNWAPKESEVYNPAFDVTPAELVTGWILDTGIFSRQDVQHKGWWHPHTP